MYNCTNNRVHCLPLGIIAPHSFRGHVYVLRISYGPKVTTDGAELVAAPHTTSPPSNAAPAAMSRPAHASQTLLLAGAATLACCTVAARRAAAREQHRRDDAR